MICYHSLWKYYIVHIMGIAKEMNKSVLIEKRNKIHVF